MDLAPTPAEAATAPHHGGSIKIGLRRDITTLDPHYLFPPYPTSNAMALIYNGITEADYHTNIVPALARAWDRIELRQVSDVVPLIEIRLDFWDDIEPHR